AALAGRPSRRFPPAAPNPGPPPVIPPTPSPQETAMKRFHVHVHVDDLAQSTRFYSTLFAAEPTVVKGDYVKWMLEDPRVNFAISTYAGAPSGIAHLGIQAEDQAELGEIHDRLSLAERPVLAETAATCCYAVSDKEWVDDPQGVRWETFWTYGEATVYGRSAAM